MYAVQQALAASTLQDVMVSRHGNLIRPGSWSPGTIRRSRPMPSGQFAKRMGAVTVEVPAGHLAMVSHPDDVAQLIKTAAEAGQTAH